MLSRHKDAEIHKNRETFFNVESLRQMKIAKQCSLTHRMSENERDEWNDKRSRIEIEKNYTIPLLHFHLSSSLSFFLCSLWLCVSRKFSWRLSVRTFELATTKQVFSRLLGPILNSLFTEICSFLSFIPLFPSVSHAFHKMHFCKIALTKQTLFRRLRLTRCIAFVEVFTFNIFIFSSFTAERW